MSVFLFEKPHQNVIKFYSRLYVSIDVVIVIHLSEINAQSGFKYKRWARTNFIHSSRMFGHCLLLVALVANGASAQVIKTISISILLFDFKLISIKKVPTQGITPPWALSWVELSLTFSLDLFLEPSIDVLYQVALGGVCWSSTGGVVVNGCASGTQVDKFTFLLF